MLFVKNFVPIYLVVPLLLKHEKAHYTLQNKLNQLGSSSVDAGATMAAFEELEAKVDKLVDKAEAMNELNKTEAGKTVETLAKEYDLKVREDDLDAQLAALKVSMGVTVE